MKVTFYKPGVALALASMLFTACHKEQPFTADYRVVPLPKEICLNEGKGFQLNAETKIQYPQGDDAMKKSAELLAQYIARLTGFTPELSYETIPQNVIVLKSGCGLPHQEAYRIEVNARKINVLGQDRAGVFHGIQTLRKSLIDAPRDGKKIIFPAGNVNDYPRFGYRGSHLDVARHMYSVDEIKQYVDLLALHNINRFHWHLTDDQGWRIEIKSRPELTKTGAYRDETVIGCNSGEYDGTPYGGFYTQEEIKDIVRYAQDRFITIIPEVDLPGHMLAALACYPELGCTGGPYKVSGEWGVFDDVLCAGNDSVFSFLEDVFDEVMILFPSEYIHIGGDECPKTRWKACPKCQARIKELGIAGDEHHSAEEYLQSYVMQRMEQYINRHHKKIIGWDEILEGGASPTATIMSWRGVGGGIEAARQGRDVIMVPTNPLYFDYYQSTNTAEEPFAFANYNPIEQVYAFDPMPSGMTPEEQQHIIGVQANLWSEYITGGGPHMQYMLLPRLAALSEVQWLVPEQKDYEDFLPRLIKLTRLYDLLGYNYARHIFDVKARISSGRDTNGRLLVSLGTPDHADVHYTLDGTQPTAGSRKYNGAFAIKENCTLKATAIRAGDNRNGHTLTYAFDINKATAKPVALANAPAPRYTFDGAAMLVDGLKGSNIFNGGEWLGFWRDDFIATIDLLEPDEISQIGIGTLLDMGSWIFCPTALRISVSDDDTNYRQVYEEIYPEENPANRERQVRRLTATFAPVNARYVKIEAGTCNPIPEWHSGAGRPGFLFVDEIEIK